MKLWSIQVLRFVAALLVVHLHATDGAFFLTHRAWASGDPSPVIGRVGVDIFFVISGLIITRTARGLSAGQFIARRARRILPLYWCVALIATLSALLAGKFGWRDLLSTWFLWPATDRMTAPVVGVAWSLCFEALFYAAFALILWRRKLLIPIIAGFGGALLLRSVAPIFQFAGNPIILEFLAGVGLAYAPPWRYAAYAVPLAAAIFLIGACFDTTGLLGPGLLEGEDAWRRVALQGVPAVLLVWGVLQVQARQGLLTHLGDASYALYLIHVPVVAMILRICLLRFLLPVPIAILTAMIVSVLASAGVHAWVEKPLIGAVRKIQFSAPRRQAVVA